MHYNFCKHFCNTRIAAVWNSIPNVVVSAEPTNIFRNRLDKFCVNQEFKFDLHADITGIGSRSIDSLSFMCKSAIFQIRT